MKQLVFVRRRNAIRGSRRRLRRATGRPRRKGTSEIEIAATALSQFVKKQPLRAVEQKPGGLNQKHRAEESAGKIGVPAEVQRVFRKDEKDRDNRNRQTEDDRPLRRLDVEQAPLLTR